MTELILGKTLPNQTTTDGLTLTLEKGSSVTVVPFGTDSYLIASGNHEVEFGSEQSYVNFQEWLCST